MTLPELTHNEIEEQIKYMLSELSMIEMDAEELLLEEDPGESATYASTITDTYQKKILDWNIRFIELLMLSSSPVSSEIGKKYEIVQDYARRNKAAATRKIYAVLNLTKKPARQYGTSYTTQWSYLCAHAKNYVDYHAMLYGVAKACESIPGAFPSELVSILTEWLRISAANMVQAIAVLEETIANQPELPPIRAIPEDYASMLIAAAFHVDP